MLTLVLLLAVLSFTAGQYRAICPKPKIEVVEGDDILLQSRLDPSIDLSNHAVDWTRDNKVVRACRRKHDQPDAQDQYRNRTTFSCKDLDARNVTLLISSAQLSDSGLYKFYVRNLKTNCAVYVTVVKKDPKTSDSSTSGPPVEEVTHPDNQDAAKMEAVSPEVVGGVAGVILAAVVAAGVIFMVKRGKIRSCKRRKQEDDSEMENLRTRTTQEDEDQHRAAENSLR